MARCSGSPHWGRSSSPSGTARRETSSSWWCTPAGEQAQPLPQNCSASLSAALIPGQPGFPCGASLEEQSSSACFPQRWEPVCCSFTPSLSNCRAEQTDKSSVLQGVTCFPFVSGELVLSCGSFRGRISAFLTYIRILYLLKRSSKVKNIFALINNTFFFLRQGHSE